MYRLSEFQFGLFGSKAKPTRKQNYNDHIIANDSKAIPFK